MIKDTFNLDGIVRLIMDVIPMFTYNMHGDYLLKKGIWNPETKALARS